MTAVGGRRPTIGAVVVAALLVAVAFVGKGGTDLERLAAVEVGLVLVAGVALAAATVFGSAPRLYGVGAVVCFLLLALLTGLSIKWSLAPDESWIEANRTLAYLLVFAGAVAAGNLLPRSLHAVLCGIALAAVVIVGYALASRVWPESVGQLEYYARLGEPFSYWNAVGVTAAMGVVLAVWFGTRRELAPRMAAIAAPAGALLIVALFLTYSRSALVAALIALGLWLLAVPRRIRSLAVLASAALGAIPAIAWALSQDAFTEDNVPLSVRADAGPGFGLLLALAIALAYGACLAAFAWRERNRLTAHARRRLGRAAVVAAGCLALAGVGAMALTERGLGGTISDRVEELTDDSAQFTSGPGRLGTTASSRSQYWRTAIDVFEDHPVAGAGAGAFAITGLRYRREDASLARHAHGYFVQTLADLGLAGLLVSLATLGAWLFAALRAVGATPRSTIGQRFLLGELRVNRSRAPIWTDERVAVTALFLAALAYGLQSALDWTWFVPAPTAMALIAAGFVAGRPPPPAPADPARALTVSPVARWRVVVAAALVVGAVACAWNAWQPQRADELADDAFALAAADDIDAALRKADEARDVNELSPKPLWARATALSLASRYQEAEDVFEQAAAEHPNLPEAWLRLADFRLDRQDDPTGALEAVEAAIYLDPQSATVHQSFIDIRDGFRALGQLPPETAPAPPAE